MRQLFTIRFVAALVALGALALGVNAVFADDDADLLEEIAAEPEPMERRIDLISAVQSFDRSPDFAVDGDGTTTGFLDATLGPGRIMRIAPGTPGEITCPNLRSSNRCVVLADMLGEAVIWFAILPRAPRATVVLPPIVDLQDGYALFENGWEILYPPVIERDEQSCSDQDIISFSDFLRRFGPGSQTIVSIETQQVDSVICGEETAPTTTVVTDDDTIENPDGDGVPPIFGPVGGS